MVERCVQSMWNESNGRHEYVSGSWKIEWNVLSVSNDIRIENKAKIKDCEPPCNDLGHFMNTDFL